MKLKDVKRQRMSGVRLLLVVLVVGVCVSAEAATNTISVSTDWNVPGSWSEGHIPTGSESASISNNVTVGGSTGISAIDYTGDLILNPGARLECGPFEYYEDHFPAGASGKIYLYTNSVIYGSGSDSDPGITQTWSNDIVLIGPVTIEQSYSMKWRTYVNSQISGSGPLNYLVNPHANDEKRSLYISPASPNTYTGGTTITTLDSTRGLYVSANDAFGPGDVTVDTGRLQYSGTVTDAIDDAATLHIVGTASIILNNNNETVGGLTYYGYASPTGTYSSVGSSSTVDYNVDWITGNGVLTVTNAPADSTAPTITNISDNVGGGPIIVAGAVTYTVQFDEPMDASTLTTNTFEDGGDSGATIDSVTVADPSVFCTVVATPTTTGTLILQVKQDAIVKDLFGIPLNTTAAIQDDTNITVTAATVQDGTWAVDSGGDWGATPNWQSGNVAYGVDSTATFPDIFTANRTVTLGGDITIGNIDLQETAQDLTISGTKVLTLDVNTDKPVISITNRTLTISSVIEGNDGLIKSGSGTLVLSGANSFTGGIDISGGTLDFPSVNSWGGSGKNVDFAGSGTVNLGFDGYSAGQISVSNGVSAFIQARNISFTSATGSGSISYGNGSKFKALTISDASGFTGDLALYLTYNGEYTIQFSSLNDSAGCGNLQFAGEGSSDSGQSGKFRLFGDAGPLIMTNRQLELKENTNSSKNPFHEHYLENDNTNPTNRWAIMAPIINDTRSNKGKPEVQLWLQGVNEGDNEIGGVIPDSSSGKPTDIIKAEGGRWILSGVNTYSGTTKISGGTLALKGGAAIADTNTVNIVSGKLELIDREKVGALQFNGVPSDPATGTWGSTASRADNKDDNYFTGTGVLFVGVDFPPSGTVLIVK